MTLLDVLSLPALLLENGTCSLAGSTTKPAITGKRLKLVEEKSE